MEDFTIGLALYDFVPVLLTGIAVYFIASIVGSRQVPGARLATIGAILVFAAGLSKATWKLIATLTGIDLVWLASLLFPLMAPGFALLAAGVWMSRGTLDPRTGRIWLAPLALIILAFGWAAYRVGLGVERGWFMPIMSLASLSNIALTVLLFMTAWQRGRRTIAVLFTVNLAMVFALIPIAQMESHSIAMHWLEQTLTAVGAAAFAYASFRLYRDFQKGSAPSARPIAESEAQSRSGFDRPQGHMDTHPGMLAAGAVHPIHPKRKEIFIVQNQSTARRRSMILAALIVVVTLFWALMLFNTNLPMLALAAIAVVSLALLSVATAWTAIAFPQRRVEHSSA
jgi:hypothetical protein